MPDARPVFSLIFDGAGSKDQGSTPFTPDSNGAIGRAFYVQFINFAFSTYDKIGSPKQKPVDSTTFWTEAGIQDPGNHIDPRIAFLPDAGVYGQWLAVQIKMGRGVMIATTDPTTHDDDPSLGKWRASYFALSGSDFPMLGYDKNGIYLGIESEIHPPTPPDPPPGVRSPQLVLIPRSKALAYPPQVGPNDVTIIGPLHVEDYGSGLFPVIDQSGMETPVATFIGVDTIGQKDLTYVQVSPTSGEIVQYGRIPVEPFNAISPTNYVRQPYSNSNDVIFDNTRIISAPICDGSNIWVTHTIQKQDGPQKALVVRWYRLSLDAATRIPSLAAWGEIFESNYDYFNPSIQAFGKDDYIVLSLSRSGNNVTPTNPTDPKCGNIGAYAAVLKETDAAPQILTLKSGLAYNFISNPPQRWGDYSTICRDPTSSRLLWMVNQYVLQGGGPPASQWRTAIGVLYVLQT